MRMEGTTPCLSRRCPIVVRSFGHCVVGLRRFPRASRHFSLAGRLRSWPPNPSFDYKDLSHIGAQRERAADFPFANSGRLLYAASSGLLFSSSAGAAAAVGGVVVRCVLWASSSAPPPYLSGAAPLFSFELPLRRSLWEWRWCRRRHANHRQRPPPSPRCCGSQVKARSVVFIWFGIRKAGFSLGLRLRWPPVASGGLRWPPVASGGLRWPRRSTSLAQRVPGGGGVGLGGPWVGLVGSIAKPRYGTAFLY